jgi:hypothetical protein
LVVGLAGADCYRIATCSGWGVAELAEGVRELAAQALVLVGEFTVAAQRNVEALAQRVVGGALPGRCRGGVVRELCRCVSMTKIATSSCCR